MYFLVWSNNSRANELLAGFYAKTPSVTRVLAASTKLSGPVYTLRTLHMRGDVKQGSYPELIFEQITYSKRYGFDLRTYSHLSGAKSTDLIYHGGRYVWHRYSWCCVNRQEECSRDREVPQWRR